MDGKEETAAEVVVGTEEEPIVDETNGFGPPCLLSYGTHVEDKVEERLLQLGFNDHMEAPFSADRVARFCGRWATEKGLAYLVMGIDDGQNDDDDDLSYEAEGSDDAEEEEGDEVGAWTAPFVVAR